MSGQKQPAEYKFEQPLPSNVDCERFILGSIMLNDAVFDDVLKLIDADSFSLEKHRRIFERMKDIRARGDMRIDRVTVAEELMKCGQLESIDGLSYLVSLDSGLPEVSNVSDYARIVRDKHLLRSAIFAGQNIINRALLTEEKPGDVLSAAAETYQNLLGRIQPEDDGGRSPSQIVEEFPGGVQAFLDPSSRQKGLMTGFAKFDEMTNGLHPGEFTILAARPSVGKTSLALNIATYVACHPRGPRKMVYFFSLEMNAASLLTRMLCSMARVDQHKFRAGFLNQDERYKLQVSLADLTEAPFKAFDRSDLNSSTAAKIVRRGVEKDELALVIIDYLQLMGTGKAENRNVAVGQISRGLKILSGECGVPVLALSQLSRPDKAFRQSPPVLQDLRDSGSLEQDADNVHFVWREELVKQDREDLRGLADLIIGKQRNGPVGKVPLRFIGQFTRFENRAEDLEQGEFE